LEQGEDRTNRVSHKSDPTAIRSHMIALLQKLQCIIQSIRGVPGPFLRTQRMTVARIDYDETLASDMP
jgi:hypothetical protein